MSCFISLCLISLKRGPSLNLELGWLVASYPHQCSYLCPSHLPGYSPHISGVTTLTSPGLQLSHLQGYNPYISRVTMLTSPGLPHSHLWGHNRHISRVTTLISLVLQASTTLFIFASADSSLSLAPQVLLYPSCSFKVALELPRPLPCAFSTATHVAHISCL